MENLADLNTIRAKVVDFEEVAERFSAFLQRENQALEAYDMEEIGRLCEDKMKLVLAYRNLTAFLIKNQEMLKNLEENERAQLKEKSLALDALLKQNELLLQTKMKTSQLVMDTIVNAVKMQNKSNSTSYGHLGNYSPLDNNHNALAINRTL